MPATRHRWSSACRRRSHSFHHLQMLAVLDGVGVRLTRRRGADDLLQAPTYEPVVGAVVGEPEAFPRESGARLDHVHLLRDPALHVGKQVAVKAELAAPCPRASPARASCRPPRRTRRPGRSAPRPAGAGRRGRSIVLCRGAPGRSRRPRRAWRHGPARRMRRRSRRAARRHRCLPP